MINHAYSLVNDSNHKEWFFTHPFIGAKSVKDLWNNKPYVFRNDMIKELSLSRDEIDEAEDSWLTSFLRFAAGNESIAILYQGAEEQREQRLLEENNISLGKEFSLTYKVANMLTEINPRDLIIKNSDGKIAVYENWDNVFVSSLDLLPPTHLKPVRLNS